MTAKKRSLALPSYASDAQLTLTSKTTQGNAIGDGSTDLSVLLALFAEKAHEKQDSRTVPNGS